MGISMDSFQLKFAPFYRQSDPAFVYGPMILDEQTY